jgi:hypothetical protein
MNSNNRRLQLDLTAARYLDALERDDFTTMADIWQTARTDPELGAILREVHAGIIEEQTRAAAASSFATLTAAVETHLPSAEIVLPEVGPVTVADVADELFRHTPDRLPAEAHVLNERLRATQEPLPDELGLSGLTAWAEMRFGVAPTKYWTAFRQAAVKLELRRAAEAEYHLAARRAPKPEEKR